MRIGVSMDRFNNGNRWGERVYEKIKEFGFDCTDFNMSDTNTEIYRLPQEQSDAILREERALAEAAGITIHQVHGPWQYPIYDCTEAERAERLEKMQISVRAAAILGAKYWIVHPIMPCGLEEKDSPVAALTWELNLKFMRELLKTAKEHDVTICLENMPFLKFSISETATILQMIHEINDDHFKMCLDTGHAQVFRKEKVGEDIRLAGKDLAAFHIHDSKEARDLHLLPYEGVVDWEDISRAMQEIGFDGVFSLETTPGKKTPQPMYDELWRILAQMADHIANG